MSLPFLADFLLQGQLDALSTKDFETLKGLKREINTRFRKWSLVNGRDVVVFKTVRDMKAELFKQIDLQEQKRWTLNLVKGSQERKARSASKLASACRRKFLQDRIIEHSIKNQALVRLTTRIVRSFAEPHAAASAFSDLQNFELNDSVPISRVLDNDLNVSVLACGLENMLFHILDKLGGGQSEAKHDGLKRTPNNLISTSIETYGRIICTIKAKEFQLDNVNQPWQALDEEIKELRTIIEDLRLILQRTEGDLAAVTSAHFDAQSKLRQKEEELSKIKECLHTQHSESETELSSRIKALKVPMLEAECDVLRREKGEIRRKLESKLREVNDELESKLREVNDEKIREMDKMKSEHDRQIQEYEDNIKQLQISLDDSASAANVKLQAEKAQYDSSIQVFAKELKTVVDEMRAMNELLREYTEEAKDEMEKENVAEVEKITNDHEKLEKGTVQQQDILQRMEGDLAAVTSAHFDVQPKLRQKEEELSKIKECLPRVAAGLREELAKLAEQFAAKEQELAFNLQLLPPPCWTGRAGVMSVPDTGALHRLQSWMQETAVHPEGCGAKPSPLSGLRVTRVMRVENQDLWHLYSCRREKVRAGGSVPRIDGLVRKPAWAVETGSPTGPGSPLQGGVNELWLFHGTSEEAMHAIVHDGFDARIARLDGLYGAGSYFADCSCKSHQHASFYITPAGERVVLACRVTMGWPHIPDGQLKNCRRPPSNPGAGPRRIFDSVFAQAGKANSGQQKHHECVVYDTHQAYPEYVIYYTC